MDYSEHGKPYEADVPNEESAEKVRVYVFGNEAAAEAFKMTSYHFGHTYVRRIGSALVMTAEAYQFVIDNTYATPATIVAIKEAS